MIPKIIHISWKTKDILNDESPLIKKGLKNLINLNSNWKIELSVDEEVDDYVKNNLDTSDYNLLASKHVIEKLDVWRLIKLYKIGGLYIDIDRFYNIPLDNIITDSIECVLPTCGDFDFSHDFMLTAPNNPIHLKTLELNLSRRKKGCTNIYFLGAQTYMHGITKTLTGKMINSNPGEKEFDDIRKRIKEMPFIKTYKESPPYDTIIYKHDDENLDWVKLKKEFYASQGLRHWTDEW